MQTLCLICKTPLLNQFVLGTKVSLRERMCDHCWHFTDKSPNLPYIKDILKLAASTEIPLS